MLKLLIVKMRSHYATHQAEIDREIALHQNDSKEAIGG
jgi:hypothetical protein